MKNKQDIVENFVLNIRQSSIFHKLSTAMFILTNGLYYSTNDGSMQEEFLQYIHKKVT